MSFHGRGILRVSMALIHSGGTNYVLGETGMVPRKLAGDSSALPGYFLPGTTYTPVAMRSLMIASRVTLEFSLRHLNG